MVYIGAHHLPGRLCADQCPTGKHVYAEERLQAAARYLSYWPSWRLPGQEVS